LTNYLELKFRPEDPCAHAAFGELSQTSDLLLRIRRKRLKTLPRGDGASGMDVDAESLTGPNASPGCAPTEDNAEDFETCADIVGRVEHTYNFDGQSLLRYSQRC
jgi:general transcription factor 3C polypeptide 5 (transcription factor C subunit 1)